MSSVLAVISLVFTLITVLGLFKPWWVLWWSALANRRKVLRYYGSTALLFFLLWTLIN